MKNETLSKEMQKNIENYSSKIETLKSFVEAVRLRPGMYIGPKGARGLLNMIREVAQNAFDQLTDPNSPCNMIWIHYNEQTNTTSVEDNGLGIPFNDIIRIFTTAHTGKNFRKQPGEYSSGLNGVGAKVTNALSQYFVVETYLYTGEAKQATFIDGIIQDGIIDIPNPDHKQGTKITFRPSYEVMGETPLSLYSVQTLMLLILSLTPINTQIDFSGIDIQGKTIHELMINKDGILTDLYLKTKKPLISPILLHEDTGIMKVDMAFCWDSENEGFENITAFSNFCPTSKGTHIDGFIDGVSLWFRKYMNDIFLGSKSKLSIITQDVKVGLNAMISAAHLEPEFTGQSKDELSNEDIKPFIKSVVMLGLDEWCKNNPQDLQKVCKYIKAIAEIRQKSDNDRVKLQQKSQNNLTGLPSKFCKANDSNNLEFWIVEGDSAGGSAKTGRNHDKQAILPIRGKISNPFNHSLQKFLSNEEVQAISTIITNGEIKTLSIQALRNYPVERVKYDKIIFGADADIDGAHINALLIRLFIFTFPQLVKAGRVYKSVPPLYGIELSNKKGISKMQYFTENIDYIRYKQKKFNDKHTLTKVDGTVLSTREILNLLMQNEDYVYEIEKIAHRHAIEPCLLELLLHGKIIGENINKTFKKISSNTKYRYLQMVGLDNNVYKIEGLINNLYYTVYYTDHLINDSINIMNLIKDNENCIMYNMDNLPASLYEVMNTLNLESLERYKGLGEMDSKKLFESTMDPENRILIQYTIDDISQEFAIIRTYESDKKKILDNIGKVSRSDLK